MSGRRRQRPRATRPYLGWRVTQLEPLVSRSWGDGGLLRAIAFELRFRKTRRARQLQAKVVARLHDLQDQSFLWPSTDAPRSSSEIDAGVFKTTRGVLSAFGYHVGADGQADQQRKTLLGVIYRAHLAQVGSVDYVRDWGAPESGPRLKKLANTIAAQARNAKRRRRARMARAIASWEGDLAYLKRTYYDGTYDFPWPSTHVRGS